MDIDTSVQFRRFSIHSGWSPVDARVISEASVGLTVNGAYWLSFLCSPTELEAMAAGFLFNEGLIQSADEIALVQPCADHSNVDIWLNHSVQKPSAWKRTSGCGGGSTADAAPRPAVRVAAQNTYSAQELLACMDQLLAAQQTYRETGGIHSSALSDGERVLLHSEDIGRHNTLDKLAGKLLFSPLPLPRRILLTTGRISSEMLQKSARLQAEVVISRTSPTSESVRLAAEAGITLIGYARRAAMNVYAHAERLK